MDKDKFLMDCIKEAYKISFDMGTKRLLDLRVIFEDYKQNVGFTASENDRDFLINSLIQLFLDIEKMCELIKIGELKESSVRLAGRVCLW